MPVDEETNNEEFVMVTNKEEQLDLDLSYIAKCVDRQRTTNGLTKTNLSITHIIVRCFSQSQFLSINNTIIKQCQTLNFPKPIT